MANENYYYEKVNENYYYKKVNENESILLTEANSASITPKLYEIIDGVAKMERYPFTLTQLIRENSPLAIIALNELTPLISKLHTINIYHSDLHPGNIVYKDRVALIDFGLSCHIDKIDEKNIDDYYENDDFDCLKNHEESSLEETTLEETSLEETTLEETSLKEKINILLEEELDTANRLKRIFKYDEKSNTFKRANLL